MTLIYHQDNFGTNLTSGTSATDTTSPLNSIPTIAAPFYIAFDATNANGHYEVLQITSKTATNVNHAALAYAHTTAEEVRMVVPAVELDDISERINAGDYFYSGITRQAIMNGNFDVWQRGLTFTGNDDTFTADRWNFLTETNASWTLTPDDTTVPSTKSHQSLKAVKTATGANAQMAIVQFIEHVDTKKLTGGVCSISFAAKTQSLEIGNLRAAVLAWNSTADTLTSDVIATWAQDGTNPTWATNWTAENTATNNALTNSWQTFTIENISLDTASTNNLCLVIWTDDGTIATGDTFWVDQVQLCLGDVALPFQPKSFEEELRACQRYYEKSFNYAVTPADNTGGVGSLTNITTASGSYQPVGQAIYKVNKRIAVTPTLYNPSASSGSKIYTTTPSSVPASIQSAGETGFQVFVNNSAVGAVITIVTHWTADAEL